MCVSDAIYNFQVINSQFHLRVQHMCVVITIYCHVCLQLFLLFTQSKNQNLLSDRNFNYNLNFSIKNNL